jgi:hypothetical protein
MAIVFFDPLALVERYDELESGAERAQALRRRTAGHLFLLSAITSVEMAAALNRKMREGHISPRRRD